MGFQLARSASLLRGQVGFASRDPEEAQLAVALALNRHRIIWRAGTVDAALYRRPVADLSIILLRYGAQVRIEPEERDGFYIVQVPVRGRAHIEAGGSAIDIDPSSGAVLSPKVPVVLNWSRGCEQILVKVPLTAVERAWRLLSPRPLRRPPEFQPRFALDSPQGRSLQQLVDSALGDVTFDRSTPTAKAFLRRIEELFVASLLIAQPGTHSAELAQPGSRIAPKYVRCAEDYMRAHLNEPESLAALARHVGVSARTLNKVFRDFRDTSPIALWRQLRLDAARMDLLGAPPGARVVDIALRWGFPHLGRFAAFYRQHYGESPKQTLTR